MRIGFVVTDYPVLTETFVRREVAALSGAGHHVVVYTQTRHHHPLVAECGDTIRQVPLLRDVGALERAVRADGVEHLHSSLMVAAHRAALMTARATGIPVTFRTYSGHDIFTRRDPSLYIEASRDALCGGFIAEDPFMADWLVEQLGVDRSKIHIVANSLDLTAYRPCPKPPRTGALTILAIARFVEKKGLIHLVDAFNALSAHRSDLRLIMVGDGPEGERLRNAAAGNHSIEFLGALPQEETLALYASADVFCLPCVQSHGGDADGVPTTVLEAMACGVPVLTSALLSMPCYVTDNRDGLLVPPGNVGALTAALERLCASPDLRVTLGAAARRRVEQLCDADRNTAQLVDIFTAARNERWRTLLNALESQRATYQPDREAYYIECRKRAVAYFQPVGRVLDIGCDQGKLRPHLPAGVSYYGCDVLVDPRVRGAFPFVAARAEALPYRDASFDGAVLFSVLPHVFDIDAVLAEAARVIKPGGYLYLQECYNDANPIHLNQLSDQALHQRVSDRFQIVRSQPANEYLMLMIARRPRSGAGWPLASIGITAFNRAGVIRRCVDSALNQTYRPLEVVVVDDGSTDDTGSILESYGRAIRLVRHDRNRGRVAAKNQALLSTSADAVYVALLDSDDYYHPQFVERCVEHLQAHPETGLVYTDDILVDRHGRELRRQPAVHPWNLDVWLRTRNIRGDTWTARRDLVMRTSLMDPDVPLDEDYDLFYQLLELTTFAHLPEPLVWISDNKDHSPAYLRELAACHAANLVKYGYSAEYAYLRARFNPEWVPAIEQGIELGMSRRLWRQAAHP